MNRRDFTRGLLALGAAPALPMQAALAAPGVAAPAATASHMYFMGWYTARMNNTCSPEMLVSKLNVDPRVAQEIFGKLIRNNTVSAPNALGISTTVDPLPRAMRSATARVRERAARRLTEHTKEHLRDMLDDADPADVQAPEISAQAGETTAPNGPNAPAPQDRAADAAQDET